MKLEISPSGRASCRGCKNPVAKGEVRFAESFTMPGSEQVSFRYWHLLCAAKKHPTELQTALSTFEGEVPDRAAVEEAIKAAPEKAGKDRPFPHADHAPTGRAKCLQCREAMEKGSWRIAVERELETGMSVTTGAGYLHPKCAFTWAGENITEAYDETAWMETLFKNSELAEPEVQELTAALESRV